MRATKFLRGLFPTGCVGPARRGLGRGGGPVETLEGRIVLSTFTVNTLLDTLDVNPGDGQARDTAGRTSLRAAVMEANALSGADTINLPAGTYALTLAGAEENAGRTGDLDVTGDLAVVGAGAAGTVINAAAVGDRIFDVLRGGVAQSRVVSLQGLTLTGGKVVQVADNLGDYGGALRIDFFNNVTVLNCVFASNSAPRTGPNLIYGLGGAIDSSGNLTIVGSRFENNLASNSGGAIYVGGSGARTVIRDCWFTGNSAQGGGGAIKNHELMTIDNSTFSDNRTNTSGSGQGGAIDNNGGGDLTITNSTLSGNRAVFGGAISNSETLTVFSSTIASNSATFGGGLSTFGASTTLKNSIVATNTASAGGPDVDGDVVSLGHNLVGNTAGSTGFSAALGDLLNADPKLGTLADNGGPTPTRALLAGSPAIDAGDPDGAPATDQRGRPRPGGAGVDIGAYEVSLELVGVFARGSTWSQPFRQYLADRGLGHASRGYRINAGDTLPWVNADQLVLEYNQDVPKAPFPAFYTLHGVRSDYRGALSFLDDRSLLLTFERPLGDAATGPDGDRFHLTDPFFGGGFDLRFNALPADVNGNGAVLADDFSDVKKRFFKSTTNIGSGDTGYSARADVDGSGSIVANDFSEVKRRFFDALPAQQAAATSAGIAAATARRRESITGEVFAELA